MRANGGQAFTSQIGRRRFGFADGCQQSVDEGPDVRLGLVSSALDVAHGLDADAAAVHPDGK